MRLIDTPQPFQYQGSKRTIAPAILSRVDLESFSQLVEPFAGSAAVSIRAALDGRRSTFWLNDANEPLIELWDNILHNVENLIDQYKELWDAQRDDPKAFYLNVRNRFNTVHQPADFLYLLSRAVKGAIRYNSAGEFNQSPDNRRLGVKPSELAKRLRMISAVMSDRTKTSSHDYRDLLNKYKSGQLWYMDPPYEGVSKKRDSRYSKTIARKEFEGFLRDLNAIGVPFILSYDGQTGDKTYGDPLPSDLGLERVEILAGRSTTSTLQGRNEQTVEALYFSHQFQTTTLFETGKEWDQMTINFNTADYVKAS